MPELSIASTSQDTLELAFSTTAGSKVLLIWQDGEIWTRNPELETLTEMIVLAHRLQARVRGDEFETYRSPGDTYRHPDDAGAIEAANRETERVIKSTRLRQWKLNASIFGAFLLLALLTAYLSRR
jgi:hypothetical protein